MTVITRLDFRCKQQLSRLIRFACVYLLLSITISLASISSDVQATVAGINSYMDTDIIQKKVITPAVNNLRIASERDPGLISWLDLLKVSTPLMSHTGPNAYATISNGLPLVLIDSEFILNCFKISDLAGLMMANPNPDTLYEIGKQYGTRLRTDVLAGKPVPFINVKLDNLNLTPAQHVSAKHMSQLAFGSAIQWVMLHEIAHHQLKHFDRNPHNYVESQKWELAADTWAIQKMRDLGFGLDPLTSVMESFTIMEEIQQSAGLLDPLAYSTHPRWKQRLRNLAQFDNKQPTDFGNWINIIEISSEPLSGQFYANELLIPRRAMPGVLGQFRQFGKVIQMPVEHFTDGSIHIYGRSVAELNEIIVSNLTSLYPTIQFKYTDIQSGRVTQSQTRGYQSDLAYIFSAPVKGFRSHTIRDVMSLDPLKVFKQYLLAVENHTDTINKAMHIQKQLTAEYHETMLQYAKGQLDLITAQKIAQQNATIKSNDMRKLLGDTKFRRMRENMLASPMMTDALQKLITQ